MNSNASVLEEYSEIIHNTNEYFNKCAFALSLYGASLLNTQTVLRNVKWEYYIDACSVEKIENFIYMIFYFKRVEELKSFCGLNLMLPHSNVRKSKEKNIAVTAC